MRRAVLGLAAALGGGAALALATPPPADPAAATRAAMRSLCTALDAPCNACGARGAAAGGSTPVPSTPRASDDQLRHPLDAWGRSLQISVAGDGVTLRSAGADSTLGSADDLVERCGAP